MLQKISTGSSCDPLPYDAVRVDHILLYPDFSCNLSCAYLALLDKSSSMIDGRLDGLFRGGPKLVGCLFLLCRSCLDVWKRPFEVEGKIKVSLVVALGYNITDESASVDASKIRLRTCQPPITQLVCNMPSAPSKVYEDRYPLDSLRLGVPFPEDR